MQDHCRPRHKKLSGFEQFKRCCTGKPRPQLPKPSGWREAPSQDGCTSTVVPTTGQRFSCNMISTITNRGALRFMIYRKRFTSDVFITFLRRLIGSLDHKIYLILDNHSVHRARKVRRWLEKHKEQIAVFYLPAYSPELNPDELLNNDVKNNASKSRRPRNRQELEENVRYYLRITRKRPGIVKKFFHGGKVAYAA